MENKKSHKKSFRIYLSIVAVLLLLQVVAWSSRSLSDAYIDYIFPIWVNTYGRITGLFPFSVGEWMIVAGILVVLAAGSIGPVMPWLLSFAAGAMMYVVVEELIPESAQGEHSNIGTIGFAVGFVCMMILDVALG